MTAGWHGLYPRFVIQQIAAVFFRFNKNGAFGELYHLSVWRYLLIYGRPLSRLRIEFQELFHRDASLTQLISQEPLFDRFAFVHGDRKNTWVFFFGQLDVAALLAPNHPTGPLERFDDPFRFEIVGARQRAFLALGFRTSSLRISRCPSMASFIISRASSTVSPWEEHPGRDGHSTQ